MYKKNRAVNEKRFAFSVFVKRLMPFCCVLENKIEFRTNDRNLILNICDYIVKNFYRNISLDDMAVMAGIGKTYFNKAF